MQTRQPLIVAYIAVGMLLGPHTTGLIQDPDLLSEIAEFGIIFLLFLLGLDMQPAKLAHTLKQTLLVGCVSSLVFAVTGYLVGQIFGYGHNESLLIGAAMIFSSTIIGIKLLPTTVLHHKRTGEVVVGLLLLQDIIAILLLLTLGNWQAGDPARAQAPIIWLPLLSLPILIALALGFVRFILMPLVIRFDAFHEYIFLLAIGWCLAISQIASTLQLSYEIGAFIAGVALATSPISQYITVSLKPLRDFFLVLFFVTIGASFNFGLLEAVLLPALLLSILAVGLKPVVFRLLMTRLQEQNVLAWEVGFRLGQISEFSLLLVFVALNSGFIGQEAATLVQATAIITFLLSSYIVVLNFPTPIAISERLRRD